MEPVEKWKDKDFFVGEECFEVVLRYGFDGLSIEDRCGAVEVVAKLGVDLNDGLRDLLGNVGAAGANEMESKWRERWFDEGIRKNWNKIGLDWENG